MCINVITLTDFFLGLLSDGMLFFGTVAFDFPLTEDLSAIALLTWKTSIISSLLTTNTHVITGPLLLPFSLLCTYTN